MFILVLVSGNFVVVNSLKGFKFFIKLYGYLIYFVFFFGMKRRDILSYFKVGELFFLGLIENIFLGE